MSPSVPTSSRVGANRSLYVPLATRGLEDVSRIPDGSGGRRAHQKRQRRSASPHERRKVIYHTEDVGQLKRMVELLRSEGLIEGDVDKWLMVVEAKRLTVDEYLEGFDGSQLLPYSTTCYRGDAKLELAPLIVFDTYQNVAGNDENNNSGR